MTFKSSKKKSIKKYPKNLLLTYKITTHIGRNDQLCIRRAPQPSQIVAKTNNSE